MKHVLGGVGQSGKVVFDESRGQIRIWQKGWIGKRKYRITTDQVSAVMYGWYTSKIRLLMRGFNLEFQYKGKNVIVTIPGEHKRFVPSAESLVRSIGRSAGLSEFKIQGASVFFARSNPEGETVSNQMSLAEDGNPLSTTEQVITGVARGAKNIASEIVSDAGNTVSGIGKVILYVVAGIIFIALLGSNPFAAFILLVVAIAIFRKRR